MWPGKLVHRLRSHLLITRYRPRRESHLQNNLVVSPHQIAGEAATGHFWQPWRCRSHERGRYLVMRSGEVTLLDYSADDSRDVVTLSDKEALVLQLYHQVQEQQLEKAFLEQGLIG
jgi:hypothetical protein